jgi:3-hydroxy-9,10-secoandrosta-1,3,5(10)-triene-9,17-dione monooxygenase reductase component
VIDAATDTIPAVTVHPDHPFATPADERDPVRRLRGRLVSPVTVLTAGDETRRTGITASSVLVVEGEEPIVAGIVGAGSEFVEAARDTDAFVVHVLGESERATADVFAGIRPAPGGMFAGRRPTDTPWGPRLDVADWAGCRLRSVEPMGDQLLVSGLVEELALSDLTSPLAYFRGRYWGLGRP